MELQAGKRYRLVRDDELLVVTNGTLEVYAVTRDKASYRQEYLFSLQAGEGAFPAIDEFGEIDILLYGLEDCQLTPRLLSEMSRDELQPLMKGWVKQLAEIKWIKRLAALGDTTLTQWAESTIFAASLSESEAIKTFKEHQQIFSMLQGMRFLSADKRLERRQMIIANQKRRLVDEAIDNLLGEEEIFYTEGSTGQMDKGLGEASFIMRLVQKSLAMGEADISLSPEIAKKLDTVSLLRRLAQKANIQLRLIKLEGNWYTQDSGTLIGYYGEKKEIAAVIPQTPHTYQLITKNRPEGVTLTREEAAKLDNDAFLCYAGLPQRKLKIRDLLRFMFRQCWRVDYRTILLVSFFAGLIPLISPVITETIFQNILPIMDREGLVSVTQVMMVASFTMAALGMVRSVAVMRISTRLDMSVEAALWGRLLALPERFFRKFTTGELASRMRGIESVKEVVSGNFVATVFNTVFSFWSLLLMCWYSLKLTAVAVAVWGIWCIVTAIIYWRVLGFQRRLIDATNKEAGLVQQIFSGLGKFRVHGAEEQAYNLWSRVFGETWRWNLALRWQNNYNTIIAAAQPFILTMLLYYVVVYGMQQPLDGRGEAVSTLTGGIGYAQFLAFEAAFTAFNATLNSVIPLVGTFFTIQPHIENLRPILEELPENTNDKVDADPLSGAIEVSHLTFAYGHDKKDVLHDISFQISAGENVAIVGHSGCGKSTLVRLLLGFEQPKSGAIYYDGQSLAELSPPSVRSQMGVVLQNGQLMTGDIFTNIVGQSALTQEDAWAAAEAAGIADDIRAMPMGMQTVISEGSSNISGGQRQRIMIARALAAKPAILIFDEATSALDNRTQAIVTESLQRFNATRLVIAHRLSTIRDCDRILVMDKGSLVESGTYDELLAQNGVFAQLVKRQVA